MTSDDSADVQVDDGARARAARATVDARRVIRELRELDERSGGRRVAWTDAWADERRRLAARLREEVPGVRIDRDEAGNVWARLDGASPETVLVGSHLDCVPGGGWLDGCLGVLAGAEVLRVIAAAGRPARSVALVDWADEEGARFGHSLLGSSAAAGLVDAEHAAGLRDADGATLAEVVAAHGVDVRSMHRARRRLEGVVASLELHIEQGPLLDEAGRAAAAVDGCLAVRRRELRFTGRAVHAGATPMRLRRDPVPAAARFAAELPALAARHDGLATIGVLAAEPATPTAVPAAVRLTLDLRHRDLDGVEQLAAEAAALAASSARTSGCACENRELYSIDPVPFDPELVARAAALVGGGQPLTSGPLHDAAAMARAGIPTAMLFVRTLGGVSHTREEDAREEDLVVAIEAFGALAAELAAGR